MGLNKFIALGNLCRDPELKFTPTGLAICNLTIAINEKRKDKEEVLFIDGVAFGKTAETISQYFKKGNPILIESRLRQENWEKDGQKRSKIVCNIDSFSFVGSAAKEAAPVETEDRSSKPAPVKEEDTSDVPF